MRRRVLLKELRHRFTVADVGLYEKVVRRVSDMDIGRVRSVRQEIDVDEPVARIARHHCGEIVAADKSCPARHEYDFIVHIMFSGRDSFFAYVLKHQGDCRTYQRQTRSVSEKLILMCPPSR